MVSTRQVRKTQVHCDRHRRHFVAANCAGNVNVPYYEVSSSDAVAFPGIKENSMSLSGADGFGVHGFANGGFELLGTFCFSSNGNACSHG